MQVGAQPYTVREELKKDFEGTVRAVAEMGYPGMQISGRYDRSPQEIADVYGKYNLAIAGEHTGLSRLQEEIDQVIADAKILGIEDVVIPGVPGSHEMDAAGWEKLAKDFDKWGATLRKEGLTFSYHNHWIEFKVLEGGKCAYDIIFENTDIENFQPEVDTYWADFGGDNAEKLLRRFAGHIRLVHAKDGVLGGKDPVFKEVGEGDLDWPPIIAAAKEGGCKWMLVEQDRCDGPPLEALRKSLENLKKLGAAD